MNIDSANLSYANPVRKSPEAVTPAPLGASEEVAAPKVAADSLELESQGESATQLALAQNEIALLREKFGALEQTSAPQPSAPHAPVKAGGGTYTVQSGDSLSAIAGATLGDMGRWPEIFDLNRDQLADPNVIQPGQVLKLPDAAAPAPAAAPAIAATTTYTVQPGDSLSAIAGATLGDMGRWQEIFDLNRDQLADPNVIQAGQVLKLPSGASAPAPAAAPAVAATTTYTVQPGDSLSAIAGATLGDMGRWPEIFDLNRDQLADPNVLQAGQVLKLPAGASDPAPSPAGGPRTDRGIYVQQPNGWTCGPTSLTIAAAAFGLRAADLSTVDEMTSLTGTTPETGIPDQNAIPNAARAIGLQAAFSPTSSPGAIRSALQDGHGVILNGSISGGMGHFLYVAGLNADGSFKIDDPYRPGLLAMSDSELNYFANLASSDHGSMIEVWR